MRVPILLQAPRFDLKKVQPQIDSTREAFDAYLDCFQPKDTRSKHGLMGPVGKILREVRSGRRDPESLKGYAIRVHEANQQYLSPQAIASLEKAIDRLVTLLDPVTVPSAHIDTMVDRLDYSLYFSRRKKVVEEREEVNREFRTFLKGRYTGLPALASAWGGSIPDWDHVYVFGRGSKTFREASEQKKTDIAAFWDHLRAQARVPAENLFQEE